MDLNVEHTVFKELPLHHFRWDDLSSENLLEQSKDTIFFKTVELAYTEGTCKKTYSIGSLDDKLILQIDFMYVVVLVSKR